MAKKFEGSPADVREDKVQAKKRGMSMKEWENSPADRAHDRKGSKKKKAPPRRPAPPMSVGPNEFSPEQETGMRQDARASRMGDMGGDEF